MKRILLVLGITFLTATGFGQTEIPTFEDQGSASIDNNMCVSLDATSPLKNFYVIDISALGFENEEEAWKQFGYIADNLLTYHVFYSEQKVTLQLHLERTDENTVSWWNAYLENKCAK